MIGIGPKEKWQSDLQKLNRAALVEAVTELQFIRHIDGEEMVDLLARAKKYGKWANEMARYQRICADPERAIDQQIRRLKAKKAAARRKKRVAA